MPDKGIQLHRTRKCDFDQHGIISSDTAAFQYVGAFFYVGIKFLFLAGLHLQIDKGGNMVTKLQAVDTGMVSGNDPFPLQTFYTRAETAGEDRNTFSARAFSGIRAFS